MRRMPRYYYAKDPWKMQRSVDGCIDQLVPVRDFFFVPRSLKIFLKLPTEPPTNKDFFFSLQCQVSTSALLETHFISSATVVRHRTGLFSAIFRSRLNVQHGQIVVTGNVTLTYNQLAVTMCALKTLPRTLPCHQYDHVTVIIITDHEVATQIKLIKNCIVEEMNDKYVE